MDKYSMAHKKIINMRNQIVNHKFRHFKGGIYEATDLVIDSETAEIMVVYHNVKNKTLRWCRPLNLFMSEVDKTKYPGISQELRFERID